MAKKIMDSICVYQVQKIYVVLIKGSIGCSIKFPQFKTVLCLHFTRMISLLFQTPQAESKCIFRFFCFSSWMTWLLKKVGAHPETL